MPRNLEFSGLPERLAQAERDRSAASVLIHLAAIATGAPAHEARSEARSTARGAKARQLAIYLASVGLDWPGDRVSLAFGRARSTVAYACQKVEDLREEPRFDQRLELLEVWVRGLAPLLCGDAL